MVLLPCYGSMTITESSSVETRFDVRPFTHERRRSQKGIHGNRGTSKRKNGEGRVWNSDEERNTWTQRFRRERVLRSPVILVSTRRNVPSHVFRVICYLIILLLVEKSRTGDGGIERKREDRVSPCDGGLSEVKEAPFRSEHKERQRLQLSKRDQTEYPLSFLEVNPVLKTSLTLRFHQASSSDVDGFI